MCFSPQADVVAGAVVTAIGVDALRHVTAYRQLPLAVLPILLAAHEFDEAFVWWGLRHQVPWSVGHAAVIIYLAFAFALPVIGPIAVMSTETQRRRWATMAGLLGVGLVISAMLLVSLFSGPVSARIDGHHIAYATNIVDGPLVAVLYVFATCGALLLSSDRRIVIFGALNVVAVLVLAWVMVGGLTSLWCAWAALASIAIALYLRGATPNTDGQVRSPSPSRRPSLKPQ